MRRIKGGLYKNERKKGPKKSSDTWHFQIKYRKKPYSGDTGQTSLEGAKEWLKKYKEALAQRAIGWIQPEAVPTLKMALEEWVKLKKGQVGDLHLQAVETSINTHCDKYLKFRLTEFTNPVVEAIRRDYLATEGHGYHGAVLSHVKGGANTVVKHLRLVIRNNISSSMYDQRPLKGMPFDLEDLPAQEEAKGVLWPEQILEFLERAKRSRNPHVYSALSMMIALGIREDETLNARWECLSWRSCEYTVTGDRRLDISTKNRGSRSIAVPEWLMTHLRELWLRAGKPFKGLILPSAPGKKHYKGYTGKPIARCAREMELLNIHPHVLRAAFATGHFEVGTALGQIQQMLDHASPETTLGYISKRPFKQAIAQERLADRMGLSSSTKGKPDLEYYI